MKESDIISSNQLPWILEAYSIFAHEGPSGLKVERLARLVKKSKSSFYHHFADMEVFIEFLLKYHEEQAIHIAQKEGACKNVIPELLEVILEFKEDLLFNRQLRIHRDVPAYKRCFEKASGDVGAAIVGIWATELGIPGNSGLAMMVLKLTMENFFLQITEETLTYPWLLDYVQDLKRMVAGFRLHEAKKI